MPGPGGGDPLDDNEQPVSIPEGGFCGGVGCNNYGNTEMGVGQFFLRFLKNAAEEAVQTVAIVGNLISDGDVDTETTKNNKTAPVQAYEVGAYNDLKNRSVAVDDLDIHHVV